MNAVYTPRNFAICTLLAALALCGCSTLGEEPYAGAAKFAGSWRIEPAASDDFDHALDALMAHRHERLRHEHGQMMASAGRGSRGEGMEPGSEQFDILAIPPEEASKVRSRLIEELRPAQRLDIALGPEGLDMARDGEPVRHYIAGQRSSRIDTRGAATIDCGWEQQAFIVRARYGGRTDRRWSYSLDAAGRLLVLLESEDAEFGKLRLATRYVRAQQ